MGVSNRLRGLAFAAAAAFPVADAAAADIAAVTHRGEFLMFSDAAPGNAIRRGLHGQGFPLIGIDVRPADGVLYGIRDAEQRRLADDGNHVRVYVPFGSEWYGYFVRRLAERPANLTFFMRALAERGH